MRDALSAIDHFGMLLGVACAIVGFAVQGPEGSVLWALVGYFLGKSIQSTYWTIVGERTA
ncbi:MAG: hypothetical protein ABEJ30_04880 [Halorientalis sp.]